MFASHLCERDTRRSRRFRRVLAYAYCVRWICLPIPAIDMQSAWRVGIGALMAHSPRRGFALSITRQYVHLRQCDAEILRMRAGTVNTVLYMNCIRIFTSAPLHSRTLESSNHCLWMTILRRLLKIASTSLPLCASMRRSDSTETHRHSAILSFCFDSASAASVVCTLHSPCASFVRHQ